MISVRFDCIFYYVSDLERACAFYLRALGLSVSSKDVVARFRIDGVLLELVPTADKHVLSGEGNARLALAVDDLRTATAELRTLGVPVSDILQVANGRLARLQDPDGNEIVLWEYQSPDQAPAWTERAECTTARFLFRKDAGARLEPDETALGRPRGRA